MSARQWLRKCSLIISTNQGDALDLSNLRIKFNVKRSDTQTPNIADIRVYNLERATAERIQKQFSRIILQAGYEQNFGVIFEGNIKQIIRGRESATDTFIDITAGDGDLAYNFAVVNKTISAGANQSQQINAAIDSMRTVGQVTVGNIGDLPTTQLPRGKVMFGMSRDYLRNCSDTSGKTWSIQNNKVEFVPLTSYLPGEAVVLTSKTGMIGTPNQTNEGVDVRCLLNPLLRIGGRVQLDNESVARLKIDLSKPLSPANIPAPITEDGVYYILTIEHQGDTRGQEWVSSLTCLNINVTSNPINSVSVGY